MCDIGGMERCVIWREDYHHARKRHICDGCGGPIIKGDLYMVHASLFEGSWTWGKLCKPCEALRSAFADEHHGPFGEVMLCIPDALRGNVASCVAEGDEDSLRWSRELAMMDFRREAAAA